MVDCGVSQFVRKMHKGWVPAYVGWFRMAVDGRGIPPFPPSARKGWGTCIRVTVKLD